MRIAICDDEPAAVNELRALTECFFSSAGIPVKIDEYSTGEALLESKEQYTILLLDCCLPGMDGVTLGKHMSRKLPYCDIIFISAYDEYLFDSYDVRHFKYILKPFDADKINRTFTDFLETRNERKPVMVMTDLSLPMSEITYMVFVNKVVAVHTKRTIYNSRKTLNQFERELNPNIFFRVNKGTIINLGAVESHKDGVVTLSDGFEVKLSRRSRSDFLKMFTRYLGSHN